jgi:hypothetical protein
MRHASVKDFEKALAGGEPSWKNGERSLSAALNWYNYHSDSKESKKFTLSYLKEIGTPKKEIEILEQVSDTEFQNLGFVCRMKLRGAPLTEKNENWISTFIENLKEKTTVKREVVEIESKPVVSIQERVLEKTREYMGEIEGYIDDCFIVRDFKTVFDPYEVMRTLEIKGAHTKHIVPVYQKKLEEIEETLKGKDTQLVEGYSFLTKKELKEYSSLLKRIIEDCTKIAHTAKLTRAPRKKKVKSVDKIIEKLQFKKEDSEYKTASINPSDIIGASQLWVFNTKTRKLGCYNAADAGGLNVKGTTLINFNEETSIHKTIRKPEVVLPATLKAGKVSLRKILPDINAVEQVLTGRINSDTILLRVIK